MGRDIDDLPKNDANHTALTPLWFLERAALVHPSRISVVHGSQHYTWHQTHQRCRRLASALSNLSIGLGHTVGVLAPNIPALYEAHFGIPMAGAVLNTINIRLSASRIAFLLAHSSAAAVIVDQELFSLLEESLKICSEKSKSFKPPMLWQSIALGYTSGTTASPKGVVLHHRGAYLMSLSGALNWGMKEGAVYLWTLPMFHCNGWCYPWTLAALCGTNICLRKVTAKAIYEAIAEYKVTHFCAAPVPEWESLPIEKLAQLSARQGVRYIGLEGLEVMNTKTMQPVPADGATVGEIVMRGNAVMKGYLKNPKANKEAFANGWFHSGDLAVKHPDGYIEIKDRSKDIIISGAENISSVEVENALYSHPAILDASVVARPDEKWGESPCAFVTLKPGVDSSNEQRLVEDIVKFCRSKMPAYSVPKSVVFGPLPKTATGKTQKHLLREKAKEMGPVRKSKL
uniref:2-succinylbenzoate--CoA ligase n=1 Tax=Cajanus cajan TaxID=3821 RepID=A0A151SBA3_CAJCA|nr:2-succinylbenzoate--CoA ligase [Cajanus cajan]